MERHFIEDGKNIRWHDSCRELPHLCDSNDYIQCLLRYRGDFVVAEWCQDDETWHTAGGTEIDRSKRLMWMPLETIGETEIKNTEECV